MIINVWLACLLGRKYTSQNQCDGLGGMIQYNVLCDKHCNSLWVHVLGCRKQEDRVKLKGGKVVKRRHTQCLSQHHGTDILTSWAACGPFKHSRTQGLSFAWVWILSVSFPMDEDTDAQGYLFGLYFFRAWKQTTKKWNQWQWGEGTFHSTEHAVTLVMKSQTVRNFIGFFFFSCVNKVYQF